ncbi:metal-dependent transcriptional regulator [Lachnospira multipara]|jgi:Mn-dependent DtxR family transcriptional regulator|uniref:metal-dependent transcriptional regulator n=1 Tax=Lachnospira multipara TaxID=28051 RepID=UPI000481AE24|nr:metal-dependent transcriptional regulator [Lachnospira multipara]
MSEIHESAENYLETILMLSKKLPVVRSIDVSNEMGFRKSSVSIAMKNLRESNYITVTKEGYIYLTDAGKEIAETILERHELLTKWLMSLGIDSKIAEDDACKIEHDLSKETFAALKKVIIQQIGE